MLKAVKAQRVVDSSDWPETVQLKDALREVVVLQLYKQDPESVEQFTLEDISPAIAVLIKNGWRLMENVFPTVATTKQGFSELEELAEALRKSMDHE